MNEIKTLTPEEVRELEMRPSDVVREKLAKKLTEEELAGFDSVVGLFDMVHDGYLIQCNVAESALYNEVGLDKYQEYMFPHFFEANKPMLEGYWDMSFHDRCIAAINAPRMFHNCKMKILGEDDKKLWFVMDPCAAGQKLYEMGCFKDGYGCGGPHPITAGGKNFPVYCCHAPLGELTANDLNTVYFYQQDYPEQVGVCSCVFNVYKNKEDVPDSYFERIGRKRPS